MNNNNQSNRRLQSSVIRLRCGIGSFHLSLNEFRLFSIRTGFGSHYAANYDANRIHRGLLRRKKIIKNSIESYRTNNKFINLSPHKKFRQNDVRQRGRYELISVNCVCF